MIVTDEMVGRLAHLARLHFNDEEKKEIKEDMQRMISFVKKLDELDTTDIAPLLHISPVVNALRDDEVKGSVSQAEALRNVAVTDGQFFKVPKVIKK